MIKIIWFYDNVIIMEPNIKNDWNICLQKNKRKDVYFVSTTITFADKPTIDVYKEGSKEALEILTSLSAEA